MMGKTEKAWLHPVLFAVFPIMHVYANNLGEVAAWELIRPLLIAAPMAAALAVGFGRVRNAPHAGGIAATMLVFFFFTGWGALLRPLVYAVGVSQNIGVRYVFAGYVLIVCALVAIGLWRRWGQVRDTRVLNLVSAFLILSSSLSTCGADDERREIASEAAKVPVPETLERAEATARPDLYFIVLDAYGRADVLQEQFGYDNTPFLDAMAARGFHVVPRAETNYDWTNESLPAAVNLTYLEHLEKILPDYDELNPRSLYQRAVLHRVLGAQGYHLAATETKDPLSDPDDSFDTILRYSPGAFGMTRFELLLLDMTPLPKILRLFGVHPGYSLWRERILHTLGNLPMPAAAQEDPVYLQAHIICPHRPFVFDAEGNAANPDTAFSLTARPGMDPPFEVLAQQYIDQVQGLNRRVLNAVDKILETADTPPVIAIVSDHGPPLQSVYHEGRRKILMLILTPDGAAPPDDLNLVELWPWILRTQLGLPAEDPAPPT